MFVYIVPLKDESVFKIGYTRHPRKRMSSLLDYYDLDLKRGLLITCRDENAARRLESVLLDCAATYNHRLDEVGGTEFFDFKAFEPVVSLVKEIAVVAGYPIGTVDWPDKPEPHEVKTCEERVLLARIAATLRNRRLALNLTREDLAKASGVASSTLKRAESGKPFSITVLIRLSLALGLEDLSILQAELQRPARLRCKRRSSSVSG